MGTPRHLSILCIALLLCFALFTSTAIAQSIHLVSLAPDGLAITHVDLSMPPGVVHSAIITIWGYKVAAVLDADWEPLYISPTNCAAPLSTTQFQNHDSVYFPSWTTFTTTSTATMRCELDTVRAMIVHAQLVPFAWTPTSSQVLFIY